MHSTQLLVTGVSVVGCALAACAKRLPDGGGHHGRVVIP